MARNAGHSNEIAALLYGAVAGIDGIEVAKPQVNGLFPHAAGGLIAPLQAWSFFWDWDVAANQVRWMTSWDTTADDVERFAAGVAAAADQLAAAG